MRARPAYYIIDPTAILVFPVPAQYGSILYEYEEGDLVHQTEHGVKWVYKQFSRRVGRLTYQLTDSQLVFFETLHNAVEGQARPFYFLEDSTAAISTAILVRKEQDFRPRARSQGAVVNGVITSIYDYTLELTEEIPAVAVLL